MIMEDISELSTEKRNMRTMKLDEMTPYQIISIMNEEEGIKIIQGKLEHNKKRFPIPGAFLQHVFGDLIPLICCEAVKII